jgi:cytochrome c-type biogenesis protein CcmH
MSVLKTFLAAVFWVLAAVTLAFAVEPDEMLPDPALEARAQDISRHLRCVVCQNQTIDDSNAPLAHDMRLLVRERLAAGDSDQEAIDYIVARYGNFVLLRPPFQADTWALWIAPFLVLASVVFGLFLQMRGREAPAAKPLSREEQRRLSERLAGVHDPLAKGDA